VAQVLTGAELAQQRAAGNHSRSELSYDPERSGQVFYVLAPYLLPSARSEGTTQAHPGRTTRTCRCCCSGQGSSRGRYGEVVGVRGSGADAVDAARNSGAERVAGQGAARGAPLGPSVHDHRDALPHTDAHGGKAVAAPGAPSA
jgi:hypothetical protein